MASPHLEMRSETNALQEVAFPGPSISDSDLVGGSVRPHIRMEKTPRLSVPRRGHVLSTAAEFYGNPIRDAVALLSQSLARAPFRDTSNYLHPRGPDHGSDVNRSEPEMAARFIVAVWVTGVAAQQIPISASLREAEQWFLGCDLTDDSLTAHLTGKPTLAAEKSLRENADVSAYFELLPYILDPHGPGSRLSVRRDPSTKITRTRKRADGVFYTPADVAEYMVEACFGTLDLNLSPSVFDPACGTGVFLRAAFGELRRRFPDTAPLSLASECLFGSDIDPWALDATAFVLLADVLSDAEGAVHTPLTSWQCMRRNLARIDTLRIDPAAPKGDSKKGDDSGGRISISGLFPALTRGPSIVLGNPPYADLGTRSDLPDIANSFRTIAVKQQSNAEIYLAFIEQMVRLPAPDACAGALVLPLSIACNIGPQFAAARKLIAETRGQWRFAFFDREPHALFGEDVKTRNTIILWSRAPHDKVASLATGPLRKWRGDSRARMFRSLRFTDIDGGIRGGIPKIDGSHQAAALRTLVGSWSRLEQAWKAIERRPLASASNADERTVFVGPTAYNFLNVFLRPPRALLQKDVALSEHPLHAITCASKQDALVVFALLSSHLAYWWWHAHGDGFHVSARFLSEFPFGVETLSGPAGKALARHGDELWSTIRTSPIISLNRGRTSLAFTPNGHDGMRRKIDEVLADLAGIDTAFVDELQQFTAHTVAAVLRVHENTDMPE